MNIKSIGESIALAVVFLLLTAVGAMALDNTFLLYDRLYDGRSLDGATKYGARVIHQMHGDCEKWSVSADIQNRKIDNHDGIRLGVGVSRAFPINDHLSLFGTAGVRYYSMSYEEANKDVTKPFTSGPSNTYYTGYADVGVNYKLTPKWTVGASTEYEYVNDNYELSASVNTSYNLTDRWFVAGEVGYSWDEYTLRHLHADENLTNPKAVLAVGFTF